MKKRNKMERTRLFLGMVEEEVYYRYVGEHSRRQAHLGESRVVMILNHVREGEEKKEENQVHSPVSQRYKKGG